MQSNFFVGRADGMARLTTLLQRDVNEEGDLRILSVEGPGGVGKSALVRKALGEVGLTKLGYMQLVVNRNFKRQAEARTLHGIVQELVTGASGGTLTQKPPGHYFPQTMEAIHILQNLQNEILAEIKEKGISPEYVVGANKWLKNFIGVYDAVATISPKAREYVDPDALTAASGKVDANAEGIAALATESIKFFDFLGVSSAKTRRNLAKTNPEQLLAQALIADLRPLLIGKHQKKMSPGHGKMPGVKRLLIVLEDYESLAPLIQSFLLGSFLRLMQTSGLDATFLVVGRDRLASTDPTWQKDFTLEAPITVRVLTPQETAELLTAKGIGNPDIHARAWSECFGLPFLLETWVREDAEGGRSALSVREFYDRVKVWMTPQQEQWMKPLVFLDRIDRRVLVSIFDDPGEASAAFEWFKGEASIRDPQATVYTMIPMVRHNVEAYYRLEGFDVESYKNEIHSKLERPVSSNA